MTEQWKDIPGYEDKYQVSNLGRVKRLYKCERSKNYPSRLLNPTPFAKKPYLRVDLYMDGKAKTLRVHRLVLIAFNPCDNQHKLEVNHKNGDKQDNRLINLEWCTRQENAQHALDNGYYEKLPKGENHNQSQLTRNDVIEIRKLYASGIKQSVIAKKYGVSRSHISSVVNYKAWKHVPYQPTVMADGSKQLSLFGEGA